MKVDNKTFYNRLYHDKQGKYSFEVRSKTDAFKFLARKKKIDFNNKIVLDIGFGSGNILEVLKKGGAICHGVEISQTAIDRLKGQGYCLKHTGGETLPYNNEYFDMIVCSHILEHIKNEKKILNEIKRILKPNGLLILGVPTGKTGYNPLHFRNYSLKDIKRLSEKLDSVCIFYHNFGSSIFRFFYKINNSIIKLLASSGCPRKSFSNDTNNNTGNNYNNIFRRFYHKIIVNILLILYMIDLHFINCDGIEIWCIFQRNRD